MNVTKIIKATAVRGRTSTAAPIIKEDYGLYLLIGGIDLPEVYEVDFSNDEHAGTSVTMVGNADGVLIPNQFIKSGKDVFAFYYHTGEDFGRTLYTIRIPNKLRPDRTEEEPTPEEQSVIDQAISALNTAVAKTAQDVISADQSARSASGDADRAERARTEAETAQGKAEEAQESAEGAKDGAETSERNASNSERNAKGYADTASEKADSIHSMTASAQTLPAGSSATASYDAETGVMTFGIPKGKDGMDGDDGYSPTANVSKSGKTATITITDKNGTTTAQVSDGTDGTDGIDGISPSVSVTDITGGHRVVVTDKDGEKSFDVEDGATGATPNLTIGTVETLDPTDDATATITGTAENPVLNLGIPKGESGETIDTAPIITDTASGAIASFSDGADNLPLKSLVVDIEPIQDLSNGDPSPDNVRPISGWTGVTVTRTGKNLLPTISETQTINGITWAKNADGSVTLDGTATANSVYDFGRGSLTLKAGTYTTKEQTSGDIVLTVFHIVNGSASVLLSGGGTFTLSQTESVFLRYFVASGKTVSKTIYPQIELGSTATDYSPYTGRSITINLGQTVYGGKLDVVTGELVVDRYVVDPSQWTQYGASNGYKAYRITNAPKAFGQTNTVNKPLSNMISEFGTFSSSSMNKNIIQPPYPNYNFPAVYMALEDDIDPTSVEFSYILREPITIQLDSHTLNSLYGANNIWADSGDTEVEYRADTKLFIERLTAPDSADMIADANITSGQYFMVGNSLYKATANIANGSAIIVGTNCIRKSLSEALNEINV